MKVTVKTAKKEGFVSSYNLFFESGLRLKTDDLTWVGVEERKQIKEQFDAVLDALAKAGWDIEGIRLT